jgi:Raf kinase inhibitor-like YbhB/YbcL family protein
MPNHCLYRIRAERAAGRRRGSAGAALLIGCTLLAQPGEPYAEEPMTLKISSTAFNDGGEIPKKYTCEGDDIAPPLQWSGVPEQARSLVLIVDDPDAPDPRAPRMTWVHWVLYNLPAASGGLPEGATARDLPEGTEQGVNGWKRTGYGGPCPPIGRHRYFYKVYALDTRLEGLREPTKASVEAAMQGHVLAQSELIGTYAKGQSTRPPGRRWHVPYQRW